ncbi:MAG: hypothetical protein NT007_13760, partial [Candidatus Kapabacteria bacterium]|nr:hypothetical protein [Candidatus Kapabacteria bacterium]
MKNEFVFMANILDYKMQTNYRNFLGKNIGSEIFRPMFLEFNNVLNGCLIQLDIFPEDCITKSGIIKARKQFLNAVKYSVHQLKTDIILLAASTKRLFGKNADERVNSEGLLISNGFTLSEYFPDILFTNGDNGTALILEMEIEANLQEILSNNHKPNIVINGLGLLGLSALEFLIDRNIDDEQIIVISNYTKDLKELINGKNIKLYQNL